MSVELKYTILNATTFNFRQSVVPVCYVSESPGRVFASSPLQESISCPCHFSLPFAKTRGFLVSSQQMYT